MWTSYVISVNTAWVSLTIVDILCNIS